MTWTNTLGEYTGMRPRKPWHDGKQEFRSQGAALAALRSVFRRGDREYEAAVRDGDTLKAYACSEGGKVHWHVGHDRRMKK